MRFRIDKPEKEEPVRIWLEEDFGDVLVMANEYVLFRIRQDGTFRRAGSIGKKLGFQLDYDERVIERD